MTRLLCAALLVCGAAGAHALSVRQDQSSLSSGSSTTGSSSGSGGGASGSGSGSITASLCYSPTEPNCERCCRKTTDGVEVYSFSGNDPSQTPVTPWCVCVCDSTTCVERVPGCVLFPSEQCSSDCAALTPDVPHAAHVAAFAPSLVSPLVCMT